VQLQELEQFRLFSNSMESNETRKSFHVFLEKITYPFCSIIKIHYTELAVAILGKVVFAANIWAEE